MALDNRPRTFCWVSRNGVSFPQIIFEPRVGCEGLTVMPGTEIKLDPSDTRSLDKLAKNYPAPISETI